MHPILDKLKERKLVQWALAYLAGAWVLIQVSDMLAETWGMPATLPRVAQVALAVGFFATLTLAWYHGERGHQRVTGAELLILAGIFGLGALGMRLVVNGPAPTTETASFSAVARFTLDFEPAHDHGVDIAPDGSTIVMGEPHPAQRSQVRLWRRRLSDLTAMPLPGSEGDETYTPSVSPDGSQVAYHSDGEIRVAPIEGGVTRVVGEGSGVASWGVDDLIYFARDRDNRVEIVRIPPLGGTEEVVFRGREDDFGIVDFQPLAGGNHAIFASVNREFESTIEVFEFSTGERAPLNAGARPRLTSSGHLMYGTDDGRLWAALFDESRAQLQGPAVPVAQELVIYRTLATPSFDISETGTLVYVEAGARPMSRSEFVWITRSGEVSAAAPGHMFDASTTQGWRLSPDDARVAYGSLIGGISEVWTKELPNGPASLIAGGVDPAFRPFWSPDGEWVTYFSGPSTTERHVWRRRFDGAGDPQRLYAGDRGYAQGSWSPDGTSLLLRSAANAPRLGDRDIYSLEVGSEQPPEPLVVTGASENAPAFSPDGRWISYVSDESGTPEVYARPFPEVGGRRVQVSTAGGLQAVWSHSGSELFYVTPDREMVSARFADGRVTQRTTLFSLPEDVIQGQGTGVDFFDVSGDDQRFLMVRTRPRASDGEEMRIVVVQNFFEELERLVPN